jgi:Zn-dependent protease
MTSTNLFITELFTDPIFFVRAVIIIILSISLHELAHGFAATHQGDDTPNRTGHLTLNPLAHMGWESIVFLCVAGIAWGQMPVTPSKFRSKRFGNILVSAAGPLLNLALAICAIGLIRLVNYSAFTDIISLQFLYLVARINLILFLFNLIPLPPLDGFYIFSEFFPEFKVMQDVPIGLFGLMILSVIPDFWAGLSTIADAVIQAGTGFPLPVF